MYSFIYLSIIYLLLQVWTGNWYVIASQTYLAGGHGGLVLVSSMASGITLHYAASAARIVHAREEWWIMRIDDQ